MQANVIMVEGGDGDRAGDGVGVGDGENCLRCTDLESLKPVQACWCIG